MHHPGTGRMKERNGIIGDVVFRDSTLYREGTTLWELLVFKDTELTFFMMV